MLPFHLCLGLQNILLPSEFPNKHLYVSLFPRKCHMSLRCHSLLSGHLNVKYLVRFTVQSAYKLSEYSAKQYFHKYWTEIHDVTTIWKRNVCSFIVTLNAFDVRPTCDTADVQAILPFPTQLRLVGEAAISLQQWFKLFPRNGISDCRTIPNVTFTVCNRHEFHDLATLPTQVMA
jgi:hypothetical protein